jgi:drug/metabolite transporter (DMT)-like permease
MDVRVLVGLVLALACAAGASLGGLWKQKGAVQTRDVDIRHPLRSAVALFRSKWFLIGWITAVIAWLLHIGALALAPLSLGQAVIAGGIVLLGLLAERFFGFQLKRRQWVGLVILGFGMAVLAVTAHAERNHPNFGILAIACFQVAAVAIGIGFASACRIERFRERHGLLLAIAAGLLFGVADVSIKAATSGAHGTVALLASCTVVGLLAGIGAFFASARSFQVGEAVGVIAATASAANLLGIIGGIVVFGEPLGNDAATITGRLLAFALVVFAVGLVPAPVRAHKETRKRTLESEPDVRSPALSGGGARPAAAGRREPAMGGGS